MNACLKSCGRLSPGSTRSSRRSSRLSDEQLREKTEGFKARLAQRLEGAEELPPEARKQLEQEALDEILPEAFACVREASVRSTGMRHFDVQMIGGMVLHRGNDRRDAHR